MKIFFGNISAGGPQNINVVQATETNTSQAVSKLKSKTLSQVSESEIAQSITANKSVTINQVVETEVAQSVARLKNKSVTQATETDSSQIIARSKSKEVSQVAEIETAQSISIQKRKAVTQSTETDSSQAIGKSKTKSITQTTETDSVENISKRKSKSVSQVLETDEALTISSELRVETVVETNTAQAITAQKIILVVEATETNEVFAIGVIKRIAIAQVTESCSAETIGKQKRISVCSSSSSYELYCDAVAGATKYIFFLEKISDNPYHLIEGMDYLDTASGTALSYKIGESASPTFSVTLPDDGSEYTSGIVVETGVGVYSGMRVQLFNTESVPVIETDTAQPISKIKYKAVNQTSETDFVDDILPTEPGIIPVFRVNETETALAITSIKIINVSAAEETEFALGLAQILKRANISFAEESDIALPIGDSAPILIEVAVVFETDKAFVIRTFNPADVNDETLQVNSSVPLLVNIIDGYNVAGVSSDFDISVNIYQDTIEVNYETPYLQEHN